MKVCPKTLTSTYWLVCQRHWEVEIVSGVSSFTLNSYRNSKRKILIPVRWEAVRGKDHQKINDKTKMKKLKSRIESNTCVVLHLSPPRNLGSKCVPFGFFWTTAHNYFRHQWGVPGNCSHHQDIQWWQSCFITIFFFFNPDHTLISKIWRNGRDLNQRQCTVLRTQSMCLSWRLMCQHISNSIPWIGYANQGCILLYQSFFACDHRVLKQRKFGRQTTPGLGCVTRMGRGKLCLCHSHPGAGT